ncbi:hypothetical protein FDJ19_gp101 [Vibrio phage Ceto]|uniref:Uncharacterized protein n=1 Tax=Vibrio phage Ceto TaxID=2570300 RepID=A0A2H5BGS4_9CAUD|nr:hypothetical protein FDJ19_gp101 [Vibrio phage Ceto]AUG85197.1 hypothetical protein CETO_215 [Vibrio phage Ceto]
MTLFYGNFRANFLSTDLFTLAISNNTGYLLYIHNLSTGKWKLSTLNHSLSDIEWRFLPLESIVSGYPQPRHIKVRLFVRTSQNGLQRL